jgi:hypothetical protein
MSELDHARKAAEIIASILASTLTKAEEENRHLYIWERDGIEWLRKQWDMDPVTRINMWTADRYVLNTKLDLDGKMSPRRQS